MCSKLDFRLWILSESEKRVDMVRGTFEFRCLHLVNVLRLIPSNC